MTKPHEKNWTLEQSGVIRIDDATTLTCHIAPWRLPRVPELDDWEMAEKVSGEVTALVIAAPDMARALMDALDVLGKAQDALEDSPIRGLADARDAAEDALRKAKVLP